MKANHEFKFRSRSVRRALMAVLAVATSCLLLVIGTGAANATDQPDPVGSILKQVQKTTQRATSRLPAQDSASSPSSASGAKHSPSRETAKPQAPDHGSSEVGHAGLAGQDLIQLGSGRSNVNDDGSTSADSTLLAIGGQEVVGSHARSDANNHAQGAAPAVPVCEQSSGAACLDLLYADSSATETSSSSDSSTHNGVANACLGGSDPNADPSDCAAPVDIALVYGNSSAHRNRRTGETSATADSQLLSVCLQRDPVLGTCTISSDVISSRGTADSNGKTDRGSDVANLAIASPGTLPTIPGLPGIPGLPSLPTGPLPGVPSGSEPFVFSIPTGCTSPSVLCIFGNQGETYLGSSLAGTVQQALQIQALDKNLGIDLAQAETLVHQAAAVRPPITPTHTTPITKAAKHPPLLAKLPMTGGVWSGLLMVGLVMFAVGAFATAWDRRRALA